MANMLATHHYRSQGHVRYQRCTKEVCAGPLKTEQRLVTGQVLKLQKQHGAALEEAGKNNKPLAQVLLEAKQAKEEAFQNQWKQMKQGELQQFCRCCAHKGALLQEAAFLSWPW